MTYTTGFVCLISTASDCSKKSKNGLGRCGASSRHITNLSNLYILDIYVFIPQPFFGLVQARLLGNNINGKLFWDALMTKHVDEIRSSLTLKKKFVNDADVKIDNVVKTFLASKATKKAKKKQFVYVGIHMR